jgi:O-antigen/teichoic acid export membrane protein
MMLVQLGASYVINPFLKNFYRVKQQIASQIERQFTLLGLLVGIAFIPILYVLAQYLYGFVITVFIHLLLISEFYKYNRQMSVAGMTALVAIIQIIVGYYLIHDYHIEGALATKALGQWLIIILLLLFRKKHLTHV